MNIQKLLENMKKKLKKLKNIIWNYVKNKNYKLKDVFIILLLF